MFRAVLTASSFSDVGVRAVVARFVRERGYRSCVIVTTAHPKKEHAPWVAPTVRVFEDLGVVVRYVDLERRELPEREDIIYVCGGNTPRLLKAARETNFKQALFSLAARGGLYIGSSAGSVLLSPTIEAATQISPADRNTVGLTDLTGLCLVPFHIVVHYTDAMKEQLAAFSRAHPDYPTLPLRNGEAILVEGATHHYL